MFTHFIGAICGLICLTGSIAVAQPYHDDHVEIVNPIVEPQLNVNGLTAPTIVLNNGTYEANVKLYFSTTSYTDVVQNDNYINYDFNLDNSDNTLSVTIMPYLSGDSGPLTEIDDFVLGDLATITDLQISGTMYVSVNEQDDRDQDLHFFWYFYNGSSYLNGIINRVITVQSRYHDDGYFTLSSREQIDMTTLNLIFGILDDYNSAYDNGYASGYENGNRDGYNNGYNTGKQVGYNEGLNAQGVNANFLSLFGAIADTPVFMIRSLFSFDIFGISSLTIFMSLLTVLVVIYFIRKVV